MLRPQPALPTFAAKANSVNGQGHSLFLMTASDLRRGTTLNLVSSQYHSPVATSQIRAPQVRVYV